MEAVGHRATCWEVSQRLEWHIVPLVMVVHGNTVCQRVPPVVVASTPTGYEKPM